MTVKKHRSRESSFNKESASRSMADIEAHPRNEKVKKQKLDEEAEKSHEKHTPKERQAKKPANSEEKGKPRKELTKKEANESREEKRTDIIEKSFALKKQFEDTPIPNNPRLIARLIVVDHIISLHEQLESPEQEDGHTPEELTDALDYMSELAEKLEDPKREVSPDIEETYDALVKAAEHALEYASPENIITDDSSGIIKEHPKKDVRQKHALLAPLILTATITNLQQIPKVAKIRESQSGGDPYSADTNATKKPSQVVTPTRLTPQLNHLSPAEARHEYLRTVAREHHTIRPLTVSAAPIATIAITSSLRSEHISTPSYATFEANTESTFKATPESSSPAMSYARELSQSTKKLEHLPLQSLLAMANSVPVGYGRYLRKEFEQNNIDKEGLIKVLKARAKGRDFTKEYQQQIERFRTPKATSREFLHAPSPLEEHQSPTETPPAASESSQVIQAKQPEVPRPLMADDAITQKPPHSQPAKSTSTRWLIIGIVTCVIICAVLLLFAFKP